MTDFYSLKIGEAIKILKSSENIKYFCGGVRLISLIPYFANSQPLNTMQFLYLP